MIALFLILIIIMLILVVLVLNTMFVVKINNAIEKHQMGKKPDEKPNTEVKKIINEEPMTNDNGVLLAPIQFKN